MFCVIISGAYEHRGTTQSIIQPTNVTTNVCDLNCTLLWILMHNSFITWSGVVFFLGGGGGGATWQHMNLVGCSFMPHSQVPDQYCCKELLTYSTSWIDYALYSYLPSSPVSLPVLPPAESVLWFPPRHMVPLHSFPTHQESTYECSAPTTHWETCSWLSSSYGSFPFPFGWL